MAANKGILKKSAQESHTTLLRAFFNTDCISEKNIEYRS